MLPWDSTTIDGQTRHCVRLPDRRFAYVEPSAKHPGQWLLRISRRPGQRVADLYRTFPTPEAAMQAAERHGRKVAA